jgi:4a-hydroxytetrahydrobiopterin dehydratase
MTAPHDLLLARCTPGAPRLEGSALDAELARQPAWVPDAEQRLIARRFGFDNFYQVMAFVNAVAEIAHAQDHHPHLLVSYAACTVSFSTHSCGGLSLNDFICAAQVSALPEAQA